MGPTKAWAAVLSCPNARMISLCACVRWPPPQGPGLRACPNDNTQRSLFVHKSGFWLNFTDWTEVRLQTLPWTQSWLQFYATTGRLAMWDADMGSGHQSWKFTVTRYEKKTSYFNLFLTEFLLRYEGLWKSVLDSLVAKKRIAWCGRSVTNSRDFEVKGMVELEIIIISNGNTTEWSTICISNRMGASKIKC